MNLLDITGFFVGVLINLLLVALICFYFKRKIDNLEVAQSEQAKMLFTIISRENTALAQKMGEPAPNEPSSISNSQNLIQGLDLSQLEGDEESDNSDENSDEETDDSSSEEEETDQETNLDEDDAPNEDDAHDVDAVDVSVTKEVREQVPVETDDELVSDELVSDELVSDELVSDDVDNGEEGVKMEGGVLDDFKVKNIVYNNSSFEENASSDYEKMTVKALKNMLSEKGVVAKSSMSKPDIIALLKNNEA